jgi:hypothetical protein
MSSTVPIFATTKKTLSKAELLAATQVSPSSVTGLTPTRPYRAILILKVRPLSILTKTWLRDMTMMMIMRRRRKRVTRIAMVLKLSQSNSMTDLLPPLLALSLLQLLLLLLQGQICLLP